jgi:hypothetical protein
MRVSILSQPAHSCVLTGCRLRPMARIPEREIERLKGEVALERLVAAAGVELQRRGKDLVGCCPFHEDRSPSLVISPAKNLWHCLGACQEGGSVIDWVMRWEGVSFRHAVELLRDGIAPSGRPAGERRSGPRTTVARLPSPLERAADDRRAARPRRRFLRADAARVAGGAGLPRAPRPAEFGAGRALPAGLCRSHAGLPAAGEERPGRRAAARPAAALGRAARLGA